MDIKIVLLVLVYLVIKSSSLTCYASHYEWKQFHIQPRWGVEALNVTQKSLVTQRHCEIPEANICYKNKGIDGYVSRGCGKVDEKGSIHIEWDDRRATWDLNRSMYIYHTGLYAMNCICTGDLCNAAGDGGKAAAFVIFNTVAVSLMLA